MATPYYKYRLGPDTLADVAALAASNGGNQSAAVREAVTQFRAAVAEAAAVNAAELTEDDWTRLGHLNDPDPFGRPGGDDDDTADLLGRGRGIDWSQYLAMELVGMWEGRPATLPLHKAEKKASEQLARRVAAWGRVRGYALMAALRWWWRQPNGVPIAACADPAAWMTPAPREG